MGIECQFFAFESNQQTTDLLLLLAVVNHSTSCKLLSKVKDTTIRKESSSGICTTSDFGVCQHFAFSCGLRHLRKYKTFGVISVFFFNINNLEITSAIIIVASISSRTQHVLGSIFCNEHYGRYMGFRQFDPRNHRLCHERFRSKMFTEWTSRTDGLDVYWKVHFQVDAF